MSTIKPNDTYYQLETERLKFISLNDAHIDLWKSFFINNPTERFLGFEDSTKSNLEKSELWISKQVEREQNKEFGQLAIIEKSSGQFIGMAGIIPRVIYDKQEYEVTYSLFQKHWGKGFATEAAILFKNHILSFRACKTAISIIHIDNNASINVAIKNGMVAASQTKFMEMPVVIYRTV